MKFQIGRELLEHMNIRTARALLTAMEDYRKQFIADSDFSYQWKMNMGGDPLNSRFLGVKQICALINGISSRIFLAEAQNFVVPELNMMQYQKQILSEDGKEMNSDVEMCSYRILQSKFNQGVDCCRKNLYDPVYREKMRTEEMNRINHNALSKIEVFSDKLKADRETMKQKYEKMQNEVNVNLSDLCEALEIEIVEGDHLSAEVDGRTEEIFHFDSGIIL